MYICKDRFFYKLTGISINIWSIESVAVLAA